MTVRAFGIASIALVLAACSAAPPTATPASVPPDTRATPSADSSNPAPTAYSGADTPAPASPAEEQVTPGPDETPSPNGGLPLPEPALTAPGDIGQALYNPSTVAQGVSSLINEMGVEVRSFDGTVVRPGADRGAGRLWLPEAAVRGLVEMTVDDLAEAGEQGGPISIADLYHGLKSSLPADLTVEQFAAAYDEAYANGPSSLAGGVMLGQPITPQTRLLRVQMWLLLVDGFVHPSQTGSARAVPFAARTELGRPTGGQSLLEAANALGVAALYQPPATSPIPGMSDQDWQALLGLLPTLAYWIPFGITRPASVHEGHGGPGPRRDWTAKFSQPGDVVSSAGAVLLHADTPSAGLEMAWASDDLGVIYEHGQLSDVTGHSVLTDGSGAIKISYQTNKEKANGRGVSVDVAASLYAYVEQVKLVIWAYQLPPEVIAALGCQCLIRGTRRATNGDFRIGWHSEDVLQISIENHYNFKTLISEFPPLAIRAAGTDRITGILARTAADEYRGTLDAISSGTAAGKADLGLAGIATCGGESQSVVQTLDVIADQTSKTDLVLRFYPASAPDGPGTLCQPWISNGWGTYLPLNDTRFSTPTTGYPVEIPEKFGTVSYTDQTAIVPRYNVCSAFYVNVTRPDPSLTPVLPPTPVPTPRPATLCTGPLQGP